MIHGAVAKTEVCSCSGIRLSLVYIWFGFMLFTWDRGGGGRVGLRPVNLRVSLVKRMVRETLKNTEGTTCQHLSNAQRRRC